MGMTFPALAMLGAHWPTKGHIASGPSSLQLAQLVFDLAPGFGIRQ